MVLPSHCYERFSRLLPGIAGLDVSGSRYYSSFGQFVQVLEYVASKLGKRAIKVDPRGTSQHCWECLNKVSKRLSERWHSCPKCGQELDRDYNSALLIQKIGLLLLNKLLGEVLQQFST